MTQKLNAAAFAGKLAEVERLLASGADPSSKDKDHYTPLHEASQVGHVEIAKRLIEAGADINAKDRFGCQPLHEAARFGKDEVCQVLLSSGAQIDAAGFEGRSALHYAAMEGNPSTVALLLEAGADPNAKASYRDSSEAARYLEGQTPLHLASACGSLFDPEKAKAPKCYVEAARLLVAAGADINASEKCIGSAHGFLNINGDPEGVRNSWNRQPMHMAGSPEMVQFLAANGADLNTDCVWEKKLFPQSRRADHGSGSPLRSAFANGNTDVVLALLECGAVPNDRDLKVLPSEIIAELAASSLAKSTQQAAGAWCPTPEQANDFADRMTAQIQDNSQEAPQQQRPRMRL